MKIIKNTLKILGILLLLFIVFDGFLIWKQTSDAREACSSYKVGSEMPNIEELKSKYSSLHIVGPFEPQGKPGTKMVIMCASATMCDDSCEISYSEGHIVKSRYSAY